MPAGCPAGSGAFSISFFRGSILTDGRRNEGDDLDRRIAQAKQAHTRPAAAPHHFAGEGAAENKGWAVGIEFVGSVLVCAFIGWLIDTWAGTAPWIMIVFLALGFAAGLRRAIKTSRDFDTDPTNDRH